MALGKRNRSRSNRPAKRMRTRSMTQRAKKRAKRTFKSRVKRTVLQMSETKYHGLDLIYNRNYNDSNANWQNTQQRIFNNRGTAYRLWSDSTTSLTGIWPQQGGSDGHREGDRIMCIGMKIRGRLSFDPNYKNCTLKAFYVPWNDVQGRPEFVNDFFHNLTVSGTTGYWGLSPVQSKRWPGIRFLGTIKAPTVFNTDYATGVPVRTSRQFQYWIPMKKPITFLSDTSVQPSNMPQNGAIVLYVTANDDNVSTSAAIINEIQIHSTLYYKDV